MSAPPKTVLVASPEEEAAIRAAVRRAKGHTVAGPEHVDALTAVLADPAVSDPIYDLPQADHPRERRRRGWRRARRCGRRAAASCP